MTRDDDLACHDDAAIDDKVARFVAGKGLREV